MSSRPARTRAGEPISSAIFCSWLIARKEVTTNFVNLKIPVTLVVLGSLFILSAHLLAADYRQRYENWQANQRLQKEGTAGGLVRYSFSDGSFIETIGVRPEGPMQRPEPLSILVKGIDTEFDRSITMGQTVVFGPRQGANIPGAQQQTPDASFIVRFILSLFALFFTTDALTREKESGTLRAMLAQPVRRAELLLGKTIGNSLSLLSSFTLAYLGGVIYLYAAGIINSRAEFARVMTVLLFGGLYAIVFICLGLFISTITTRTKVAVVTALLSWGTIVLVLPTAAVITSKLLSPAPSYNQLNAQVYEARQRVIQAELSNNPGIKSIFESPNSKEVLARLSDISRQLTDDYMSRNWSQVRNARVLASLSPAGALTFGLSDMAGTGANSFRQYLSLVQSGRDRIIEAQRRASEISPAEARQLVRDAFESASSMQREPEPLWASMRTASPAAFSMIFWAGIFAFASFKRINKYDVR